MNEAYKKLSQQFYFNGNDPLKLQAYYDILDLILPQKESLTVEQTTILNHITNSINLIEHILLPFEKLGIDYDLTISGGAIYDLVCHLSDIKDIDIILSFPQIKDYDYLYDGHASVEEKIFDSEFTQLLSPLHEQLLGYKKQNLYYHDLTHIISLLAQTHSLKVETFYSKNNQVADYLNKVIAGICKINPLEAKPIDLILSRSPAHEFIHFYDFNLCQMSLIYKKGTFQCHKDNLINHIFMTKNAAYDVTQKKITLKADKFNQEHIEYFLNKHFLRLREKLPEFEPIVYGKNIEKVNIAQAMLEKICFERDIQLGESKKKIKI
jgi:BarA-like signal transduction histidine kinase